MYDLNMLLSCFRTKMSVKEAPSYLAKKYREELMSVFSTGRPNENSFHADRATSGINVTDGGDVITKTIRLRYVHLRGWVENQDTFKVNHEPKEPTQFGSVSGSEVQNLPFSHSGIVSLYRQNQKNQSNLVLYLVRRSKIFVSVATLALGIHSIGPQVGGIPQKHSTKYSE